MISKELLRSIRDSLPMEVTIRRLGNEAPPSKHFEGYFRFLCPNCGELRATVNPRNNLAHCFCCQRNYNNIDLLIALGYDFPGAPGLPTSSPNGSRSISSGPTPPVATANVNPLELTTLIAKLDS